MKKSELRIAPEEHPLLMTEVAFNPNANREKTTQIMFETFNVPAFYLAPQALLTLFSTGCPTGLAVETGDGVTTIVSVNDGTCLVRASSKIDIGGQDLTAFLIKLLIEKGCSFTTSAERGIVKDIKEKLCSVSSQYDEDMKTIKDSSYELPDGNVLTIGNEKLECSEAMFQPDLIGKEQAGLHQIIADCIQNCDVNLRKDMYSNIVIGGGNSMLSGFAQRLAKELALIAPNDLPVKISAKENRKHSAFIGGSILSSLTPFQEMWFSKEQYDEHGPTLIHKKCT
ncbi:actin [Reticulomyxa filosa]|uniref:Actin n=1 Tax=Reticulomyxa filosa TaxID=46433 RepID=X6MCZ0_RETFI|nr:actin [Reticulomyxa filosa]|eukprot:ETO10880.1 actin [Reticulomyxa filosa]